MQSSRPTTNPFATSRVRPGALEFQLPADLTLFMLANQLAANGWRGQIIGPHGSGKSTLTRSLLPQIRNRGREPLPFQIPAGQRVLPRNALQIERWNEGTLLVVDGYEQLGPVARLRLRNACARRGVGLLATAHRPIGLPLLYVTSVNVSLALGLVTRLTGQSPNERAAAEIAVLLRRHQGNLREVFFELYDRCSANSDAWSR